MSDDYWKYNEEEYMLGCHIGATGSIGVITNIFETGSRYTGYLEGCSRAEENRMYQERVERERREFERQIAEQEAQERRRSRDFDY